MDGIMEFTHLRDALAEYGEQLRAAYRQNLASNHHPTREDTLRTTAEWKVDIDGTDYLLSLNLQEYWKNVEEGQEPQPLTRKLKEDILHWITIKPVLPRPNNDGSIPSPRSLAYLISRKIAKDGTEGTHDLQEARDTLEQQALDAIGEAIAQDIDEQMGTFLAVFRHKSEY